MVWSSPTINGSAMGLSRSETGRITGRWIHESQPLVTRNGGHGMIAVERKRSPLTTQYGPRVLRRHPPVHNHGRRSEAIRGLLASGLYDACRGRTRSGCRTRPPVSDSWPRSSDRPSGCTTSLCSG